MNRLLFHNLNEFTQLLEQHTLVLRLAMSKFIHFNLNPPIKCQVKLFSNNYRRQVIDHDEIWKSCNNFFYSSKLREFYLRTHFSCLFTCNAF